MQPVLLAPASPSPGHFPEAVGRGKNREGRREDKWQSNGGQLIYCSQIFLLKVAILWLSETSAAGRLPFLKASSDFSTATFIFASRHGSISFCATESIIAVFVIIPDTASLLASVEAKGKKRF